MSEQQLQAPSESHDLAATILSGMKFSEERGDYRALALRMQIGDAEFRQSADPEQLEEYISLRQRAASAFEYERLHGRGSLLRLDHPFTRQLIKSGMLNVRRLMEQSSS